MSHNAQETQQAAQSAARAARGGPNEIIRPQYNQTYRLELGMIPEQAQQVNGAYGPQWMYFFDGAKLIYADQKLHQAIMASGAEPRSEIAITRTKRGRETEWLVEHLSTQEQRYKQPPCEPHKPLTPYGDTPEGRAYRADLARPLTQSQQQMAAHRPVQPESAARMLECYAEAIDVAAQAEHMAKASGLALRATFEDVRSLAATLYINRVREEISR